MCVYTFSNLLYLCYVCFTSMSISFYVSAMLSNPFPKKKNEICCCRLPFYCDYFYLPCLIKIIINDKRKMGLLPASLLLNHHYSKQKKKLKEAKMCQVNVLEMIGWLKVMNRCSLLFCFFLYSLIAIVYSLTLIHCF